jgi:threonine dehydratase
MVTREKIAAIEARIRPYIRRTPVVDPDGDGKRIFKLELLQHSGSFKARGAFTNLLTRKVPKAGVVAASGGNHGAAVAYAAQKLGQAARIYVPTVSSPAKIDRIRSYGAELVVTGERYADALAASEKWAAESGALQVHAYDQEGALLGQGTVGMEFEAQAPWLDTLLVAVGGGGLIAGVAAALHRTAKVVAVEPENCPSLHAALAAGGPVDVPVSGVAADSLGARRVGAIAYHTAVATGTPSILVEDRAIVEARRRLWDDYRIAVEHGTAAAYAALTSGAYRPAPGERVVVLLCGANTDPSDLA